MSRIRHSTKRYVESVTRAVIFCTDRVVVFHLRLAVENLARFPRITRVLEMDSYTRR